MTAKEYLKKAYNINQSIDVKTELLKSIETTIPLTSDQHLLTKLQKEKKKLKTALDKDIHTKMTILDIIENIDDFILKSVLLYKYICGMTNEEIGHKLNYTTRHIVRMHTKAVTEAEKFYKIA